MALTTDEFVASCWGITPGSDPTIAAIRPGVEQAIKSFVGWGIELSGSAVTDYYDGTGTAELPLRRLWVLNDDNLAVRIDPAGAWGQYASGFPSSSALTKGTDYALVLDDQDLSTRGRSGLLVRLAGSEQGNWSTSPSGWGNRGLSYRTQPVWPWGRGNIRVVCKYGFATIPTDIQIAVAEACAIFKNLIRYGVFVTSESLGDYNYSGSFQQLGEFADIRKRLGRYRDLGV